MSMMTLAPVLAAAAARSPEALAVVDGERRLTYAAWVARVHRLARGLVGRGIQPGERVAILLKNREEHATLYWACQRIGAVATPLNWRLSPGEFAYCAEDAGAVMAVCEAASAEAVLAAREGLPGVRDWLFVGSRTAAGCLSFESLAAGDTDPGAPAPVLGPGDTSIMLYTSGTTGRPKGVPRSHQAEYSAAVAHIVQSRNGLGDRTLAVMPLYHTMGVRSMIAMALLGGTLVCLADWEPEAALESIARERVNALYLVPTLFHDLVHHPALARYDLGSVTHIGYAGAAMTSALTAEVDAVFRPTVFLNHLGSTEIYTFTVCDRVREKPMCAGRAGLFGQVRIVRPDQERGAGPEETVAPGETGELICSMASPEAFTGYWQRPDADARAIRDGWYYTGDLVHEDGEGDIYTVGRVDDMIVSGGENIYPLEVEDVLDRHPAVAAVCVVGLPDERLGQRVAAFVVPRGAGAGSGATASPPLDAETLDRFCRESPQLASFKRPRQYEFVAEIPKGPTGKVLRRLLVEAPGPASGEA